MQLKRALTLQNIADAKVKKFDFTGEWFDAFGTPEATGAWYIFGSSGSGKTSFILLLIKQLSNYENILFVSYEEGEISEALKVGINRFGMLETKNKVHVVTDTLEELEVRLSRRRRAKIVIIDSLEYSEFKNLKQVRDFVFRYPDTLFVFIGQAEGERPSSELGKKVLFFSRQKIYIEGYRASTRGRSFGEKGYYTIWHQGAEKYWLTK